MNEYVLAIIGGLGGFAGVVSFLRFLNTRKSAQTKDSSDAFSTYQVFVSGATSDRDKELLRVKSQREALWGIRSVLIDLVLDLLAWSRSRGATIEDLEPYHTRLDHARSTNPVI